MQAFQEVFSLMAGVLRLRGGALARLDNSFLSAFVDINGIDNLHNLCKTRALQPV